MSAEKFSHGQVVRHKKYTETKYKYLWRNTKHPRSFRVWVEELEGALAGTKFLIDRRLLVPYIA